MMDFRKNPFPGLRPFREEERALFFGREEEINVFCSEILSRRLFVLHGKTGVGKTSFLVAGVGSELKESGFKSYRILFKNNPFECIESGVFGIQSENNQYPISKEFKEGHFFESIYSAKKQEKEKGIILLFDQFEDLFTATIENRLLGSFGFELASIVYNNEIPIKIVISIRNDFLFELDRLRNEVPDIFKATYYLHDLTRENARKAIEEPSSKIGIRFDEKLVARLLEDLSLGDDRISAPPLQIICRKLTEHKSGATIGLDDYEALGGKEKILNSFVEAILEHKTISNKRKAVIRILEQLHFQGQTKYPRPKPYLQEVSLLDEKQLSEILEHLEKQGILAKDIRDKTVWFELKHDYLIQPIDQWISKYHRRERVGTRILIFSLLTSLICSLLYIFLSVTTIGKKLIGTYDPSIEAREFLLDGQKSLEEKNMGKAIAQLQQSIHELPTLEAYESLIKAYSNLDSLREVEEIYESALELVKNDTAKYEKLTNEAYNLLREKNKDRIAASFLTNYLEAYKRDLHYLPNDQQSFLLQNHFREQILSDGNPRRQAIVNSALNFLNSPTGFKIDDSDVTNSFEFIHSILRQQQLAKKQDSFDVLQSKLVRTQDPEIGDLVYFQKGWEGIVGLYLGKFMNRVYCLTMGTKSDKVAFQEIQKKQSVEYRKLP